MKEFTFNDILDMQRRLQAQYSGQWEAICPENGKNKLLWMVGEIGEVIDVVKKNGHERMLANENSRHDLIEEMADVLMYFGDVMLCYGISAEELGEAYEAKFKRNMTRW